MKVSLLFYLLHDLDPTSIYTDEHDFNFIILLLSCPSYLQASFIYILPICYIAIYVCLKVQLSQQVLQDGFIQILVKILNNVDFNFLLFQEDFVHCNVFSSDFKCSSLYYIRDQSFYFISSSSFNSSSVPYYSCWMGCINSGRQ